MSSSSSASLLTLVSGGNQGIGFSIIKNLCGRSGFHILLGCRDPKKGEEALRLLESSKLIHSNSRVEIFPLDLNNEKSILDAAQKIKNFGGLDILINNAGMAYKGSIFNEEVARETIGTNYFGTLHVLEQFTQHLKPNARIVNVSSSAGQNGLGNVNEQIRNRFLKEDLTVEELSGLMNEFIESVKIGDWKSKGWVGSTYAVSKIGMTMLGRIWAKKLPKGTLINSVCPGYCKTSMAPQGIRSPDEGALTPVKLALLPQTATENGLFWRDDKIQPYY